MSIKLDVDPWCDNCPDFESYVNKDVEATSYYDQMNGVCFRKYSTNTVISCERRERCRNIKDYLKKEKEND